MKLRITQKALVWNKGKFLILKTPKHGYDLTYPDHWDLPGGGLESEHPVRGIKREIKEEANIQVSNLEPFHTCDKITGGKFRAYILWSCKYKSGKVKISNEHTEFRWVTKKDLKGKKLYPFIKDMLKKGKL